MLTDLDPTSIIFAGLLLGGVALAAIYDRRHVVKNGRKPDPKPSIKVSDARSYSRRGAVPVAFIR